MAYLDLINVSKVYGSHVAVEGFNLEVGKGEFVSFLGPSGCGKTTTLRMIAGFETPTSGTIRLNDVIITTTPPNRRRVGMVFQSYALFPNMTVAENIAFGLTIARRPKEEINKRVAEMLALIKMESFGPRYPAQLSGGQQQRVALARALAIQPTVLLLDEPLSALDAKIRIDLRNEIRSIQRQLGITTIYVTHDQEEALSLSDRIVVMSEGHVEQIGEPFEIYNNPRTKFVASFIGTLNYVPAEVRESERGRVAIDGQEITLATKPIQSPPGSTVMVGLRPESLSLGQRNGNSNLLRGNVEHVAFLGPIVRIEVSLGAVSVHLDEFNSPQFQLPQMGDQVSLSFPPEACFTIGATDHPLPS
ncbi:MAG: ABC transporter ATP-binding protein [Anaerolineae bacterium]